MLSRIYTGHIHHARREPKHEFTYPVWYVYLDLDEIERFAGLSPFISLQRFNLLSFHRQDYLPGPGGLKHRVRQIIHRETGQGCSGKIFLLTTLRQLGFAMNPLSLFYCFDAASNLSHVVAEVHNTPWNERFTYVLTTAKEHRLRHAKAFHVSPFLPMNLEYVWRLATPGETLEVDLTLMQAADEVMRASLFMTATEVSGRVIHRQLLRLGWQSLTIPVRIYRQALALWRKKAIFWPHPKHARSLQEEP